MAPEPESGWFETTVGTSMSQGLRAYLEQKIVEAVAVPAHRNQHASPVARGDDAPRHAKPGGETLDRVSQRGGVGDLLSVLLGSEAHEEHTVAASVEFVALDDVVVELRQRPGHGVNDAASIWTREGRRESFGRARDPAPLAPGASRTGS